MKTGMRKPSIKKSVKARTTGKIKRSVKKSVNPLYGKKGMGYVNDPKKAVYNSIYHKTTVSAKDVVRNVSGNEHTYSSNEKKQAVLLNNDTVSPEKLKKKSKTYKTCGHAMRMIAIITGVVIGLPLLVGTVVGGILIILLALFEWKLANTWLKMSEKIMEQPEIITEEQFQPAEQFQLKDEPECEIKIYKVAGTSYRVENILKLARENPDYKLRKSEIIEEFKYGKRLYQYEFYPDKIELIPEPDNPEDKHAIKVIADNIHIGYIKASDCRHLLKVISENRIKNIDCEISGGKYKIVVCEDVNYEETYFLRRDEINYYAKLTIEELLTSNQG